MKSAMDLSSATISRFIEIEPNKPLHHHWSFWWPIVVFGSLSCYVGFKTNDFALEYLVSPKVTMDALSYPLFVLSFALPIVLAVGRFHASAQRAETIRISESTMSFKHYYDHREAFSVYMEGYKHRYGWAEVSLKSWITLYEIFYPNASMERFDIAPSSKTHVLLDEALSYAHDNLLSLRDENVACFFSGHMNYFQKLGIEVIYDTDAIAKEVGNLDKLKDLNLMFQFLYEIQLLLDYANEFDRKHNRLCDKAHASISKYLKDVRQYTDVNTIIADRLQKLIKYEKENAELLSPKPDIRTT